MIPTQKYFIHIKLQIQMPSKYNTIRLPMIQICNNVKYIIFQNLRKVRICLTKVSVGLLVLKGSNSVHDELFVEAIVVKYK